MKLSRKNKSLYNQSLKRPISNTHKNKNINLFPLFIQITKKGSQHSKLKEEEISLGIKNKNLNINNISNNNNNNNNHAHSNSSLYINFFSPIHNPHYFQNQKNKSNIQSLINDSQKNNNMVLTSVDNSSAIGSKEKIMAYNQNSNNLLVQNKNKNNKKYPRTALNSRKNSVDKKRNNKSLFQKCQKVYNKNSVNLNSNRNRIFQSNNNVKTYSNKNLLRNTKNNNSKIKLGDSNFNNYIKNSKLQKNLANNKKSHLKNLTNFLYNNNNNYNNHLNHKKNVSITHTAKISPAASFINTNSKSLKSIHNIKNKSKINEIIKNVNNNGEKMKNNFMENNKENKLNININKKKNSYNNMNFNSFNNFYNILNNNNPNINNNNNNNNCISSNIENILNNCQTTSCGAFYNNYNININNLINNHIIYNNNINNNNYNNNSRKKLNLANLVNNKKISRIISQSQQEILQIKKNVKKNFTSNNSPNRFFNYKIASSTKKIKNNQKNNLNNKKNNFLFSYNNNNNINKNTNTNIKIFNALRNAGPNKKSSKKIKSKSTEKLNMQIKSFKEELNLNLNIKGNNSNLKNSEEDKKIKVNNSKINSYDKLNNINIRKSKSTQKEKIIDNNFPLEETIKKNIYMESSLSLTEYIKNYYKKNKKYPNTNLSFYKYGRLIGQGAFGKVNLGLNVLTGRVVAIKSFNKKNFDAKTDFMKKIIYETNLMKKLNHKNITKILEMFEDDKYILIIMEYINGGNLFSFVKKRRKLSEKISKFLFKQIILGLQHIHSHNIVHRDVKLENILIDLNNTIKICDFGIGRVLSNPDDLLHDQCGTPMYMAPEILFSSQEKGYKGFPVDIWSAGIALYIMLSGSLPFSVKKDDSLNDNKNKKKNMALRQAIMHGNPKKIENISEKARDLLHGLLNKDPNKRLTIEEILNHPWLKEDENYLNNNNNKYHLFTKAEMIMLSKTYIDYRKASIEELQENFTISNLKREKDIKTLKNITTKSFILTPYNSIIEEDEEEEENSIDNNDILNNYNLDDNNNSEINLENDLISFDNKVKEYNMLYELNNNKEVDNGMLINSKINSNTNSLIVNDLNENSQVKTESVICFEEEGNINDDKKIVIENNNINSKEINEPKDEEKILEKIEKMGYDKKYVKECLENNILCQATAAYFLLMNYDKIN